MVKAGFVVRNKFQIRHFEALSSSYPGAEFLLIHRKTLAKEFSRQQLTSQSIPVRLMKPSEVRAHAEGFDVLFFQTVFPGIETIDRTPLVSVQYGLAKERHNYGEWRALADMNLMFGPYSANAVSHFSPSVAVGNLKFAGWRYVLDATEKAAAKARLGLSANKPVILYMPTYGELGSFDELVGPLSQLLDAFDIVIKGHHNDEMTGLGWMKKAKSTGIHHLFNGGADPRPLLEAADLVLSDFSGAIFDAVYAKVPVVLFQPDASSKVGVQKFDLNSLEFRGREELGEVCTNSVDLRASVERVLSDPARILDRAAGLREQLFVDVSDDGTLADAVQKVHDLLEGKVPALSQAQYYTREAIKRLICTEQALKSPLRLLLKTAIQRAQGTVFKLKPEGWR